MSEAVSRQFSFRLPESLVDRVERCAEELRASGLDVTRTDVVRLLLKHALDATHCDVARLLRRPESRKKPKRAK